MPYILALARSPPAPAPSSSTTLVPSPPLPGASFSSSIRSPAGLSTIQWKSSPARSSVCSVEALTKANTRPRDVAASSITNQRETVIVWDHATGQPVYPAIVWQDHRTDGLCKDLEARGLANTISEKTGLVLDPYFSATKIKWILDNVEGVRRRAARGELALGTVDTGLIWNLTSGRRHVTDVTNASRTLLFNIMKGE